MAFNWDKLVKAQRDFPKPKFALDNISRHLKKRPSDPYVLAWKASVLLQVDKDGDAKVALDILQTLCQRQPPITDPLLLCFIYNKLSEALRSNNSSSITLTSVGEIGLKAWQNAAKALPKQAERLNLWSELFISAMQEDFWEDVRIAIVHANKEGPKSKKNVYYTSILANQLAAEKKVQASKKSGKPDPSSQIQFMIALKQMKEAFDNSPKPTDETIRVKDMRDLRFMASIYCRQNRCAELEQLWTAPSSNMDELRSKYDADIRLLLIESVQRCKNWQLLEKICENAISDMFKRVEADKSPQAFVQMCTAEWKIWTSIIDSITHLYPEEEAKERIANLHSRLAKIDPNPEVRAVAVTLVNLASHSSKSVLEACKTYWSKHSASRSCFKDLRRSIARLPEEERNEFYTHIKETSRPLKSESKDVSSPAWIRTESNILSFEYLLTISLPDKASTEVVEKFVAKALTFHHSSPSSENDVKLDAALLAIVGLIRLYKNASENSISRLIQATVFVRHLMEDEDFRNFRALTVVSARLHLNLGLGTIAFQHYRHAKVKEMLQDTVSWALLSRISQTHPLDVPGYNGFSATIELNKVIDTITRMEDKTDDHLYNDMEHFLYDTALDMLDLKAKFHSSITKRLCIVERNRIAALEGMEFDITSDSVFSDLSELSDNRDQNIVPNFGPGDKNETISLILEHEPASAGWLHNYHLLQASVQGSLPNTPSAITHQRTMKEQFTSTSSSPNLRKEDHTAVEVAMDKLWSPARYIVFQGSAPGLDTDTTTTPLTSADQALDTLASELDAFTEQLNNAAASETPLLFTENHLMHRYSLLEALRMLAQLDKTIAQGIKSKNPAYAKLSKPKLQNVNQKVKLCYEALRKATTADNEGLPRKAGAIREAVGEGRTGEALKEVVGAEDVRAYVDGYVESNRLALRGILQIKLN